MSFSADEFKRLKQRIRQGVYRGHTSGLFPDKVQANLVILPEDSSKSFGDFCRKNRVPCPLIHQSQPGEYRLSQLGDLDIRSDAPAYWIYKNGRFFQERNDILDLWQEDWVSFLIGCSFTFEPVLMDEGIILKHVLKKCNVAMYRTNIPLNPEGIFRGSMVVSMRWIKRNQVDQVVAISERYPDFHGAPVHIGDPTKIGIYSIEHPDYGEFVPPDLEDVPVFWGCGVTPQACLEEVRLPLVITHKPGSMVITDLDYREVLLKKC